MVQLDNYKVDHVHMDIGVMDSNKQIQLIIIDLDGKHNGLKSKEIMISIKDVHPYVYFTNERTWDEWKQALVGKTISNISGDTKIIIECSDGTKHELTLNDELYDEPKAVIHIYPQFEYINKNTFSEQDLDHTFRNMTNWYAQK